MKKLAMRSVRSGDGDGDEEDKVPGQPWTPTEEPSPDGQQPEGDGKHRK